MGKLSDKRIVSRGAMNDSGRIAAAAALLLLAACADFDPGGWWQDQWETGQGSWENPDVAWEQWDDDRAECRLVAAQEADRDFAITSQSRPAEDYSRGGRMTADLDRFEAGKREQRLFERCLTDRGYRRVQRSRPPVQPSQ
jgi:hypothetical protein